VFLGVPLCLKTYLEIIREIQFEGGAFQIVIFQIAVVLPQRAQRIHIEHKVFFFVSFVIDFVPFVVNKFSRSFFFLQCDNLKCTRLKALSPLCKSV
jgi:hypothetical protein